MSGYIYIVTDDIKGEKDVYKIGRTGNGDEKRLISRYKTALPSIQIIRFTPCSNMIAAEKYIHNIFKKYRMPGEWFHIERSELLAEFDKHINNIPEVVAGTVAGTPRDSVIKYLPTNLLRIIAKTEGIVGTREQISSEVQFKDLVLLEAVLNNIPLKLLHLMIAGMDFKERPRKAESIALIVAQIIKLPQVKKEEPDYYEQYKIADYERNIYKKKLEAIAVLCDNLKIEKDKPIDK